MGVVEKYTGIPGSWNTCIPERLYQNLTLIKIAISETYSTWKFWALAVDKLLKMNTGAWELDVEGLRGYAVQSSILFGTPSPAWHS